MEAQYTAGISVRDGFVYVDIAGEVDMVAAPWIHRQIADHLGGSQIVGVVVDLAGVTFMDSAGINLLLDLRRAALAGGTSLRVGGARSGPAAVLEMTGVADLFAADADLPAGPRFDGPAIDREAGGAATHAPIEDGG